MHIPSVVIIGRPNVGKSSLFNALCGERVAIVEPTAGVTRDRLSRTIETDGAVFELWDTGGMGLQDSEELAEDVERQIRFAVDAADLVLFVVDVKVGRQPMDESIARQLHQAGKNVVVVVNKCDNRKDELGGADFHALGFDRVEHVAASHRHGIADLLALVASLLPEALPGDRESADAERLEPMRIAFVGRRNVGKSTLVNCLAQEPRVIVSEVPGTTRDAIDVRFRLDGLEFVAIDTAGVRRRKQIKDSIDFYSMARAKRSIQRADVVVHVLDAPNEVSRLDKQLADEVTAQYKPCVLALNKMDLARGIGRDEFEKYLRDQMPGVAYAPIVCISGLTGENIRELIDTAQALHEQSAIRVRTSKLWHVVQEAVSRHRPRVTHGKTPRVYYAAQVRVRPPTIVLFTNQPDLFGANYQRYLANRLREALPYHSIPIRFVVRGRDKDREAGR